MNREDIIRQIAAQLAANEGLRQGFSYNQGQDAQLNQPQPRYAPVDPRFSWSLRGTNPMKGRYSLTGTLKY